MLDGGIFLEKASRDPTLLAPELDAAPLGVGGSALPVAHARPLIEGQLAAAAAKILEPAGVERNAGEALAVGGRHVAQMQDVIDGNPGHGPKRRHRMHLVLGNRDPGAAAPDPTS